ncbi:hypothetical protein [Hymenobacter sp. YC55]|uniref:hypothetical protein n=1 Tax=Hymenobacter sp. YC55 TaxID=3034019 RepID=UPI0023FA0F26|nr:hypothetical protein [Hymenobacter sp. YC55]MDF7810506.1 hypothetical protein [Hymenobacter sp. YC55]
MAQVQHPNTMKVLLEQARELNRQICALPAKHPRQTLLEQEYSAIQAQIRTLRSFINQTWL